MFRTQFNLDGIPCVLWGEAVTDKLIIAIHGHFSHKEDACIAVLADVAVANGYQVLSFDLPAHGERNRNEMDCHIVKAVADIRSIFSWGKARYSDIGLFACSIGVTFGMIACENECLTQAYFLSPVVNLEQLVLQMMDDEGIDEAQLRVKEFIISPSGSIYHIDYLNFLRQHHTLNWNVQTHILTGEQDPISEVSQVQLFASLYHATFDIVEGAEHYFNRFEEINCFRLWLQDWLVDTEINN